MDCNSGRSACIFVCVSGEVHEESEIWFSTRAIQSPIYTVYSVYALPHRAKGFALNLQIYNTLFGKYRSNCKD